MSCILWFSLSRFTTHLSWRLQGLKWKSWKTTADERFELNSGQKLDGEARKGLLCKEKKSAKRHRRREEKERAEECARQRRIEELDLRIQEPEAEKMRSAGIQRGSTFPSPRESSKGEESCKRPTGQLHSIARKIAGNRRGNSNLSIDSCPMKSNSVTFSDPF